jgi:hypothetical protein
MSKSRELLLLRDLMRQVEGSVWREQTMVARNDLQREWWPLDEE